MFVRENFFGNCSSKQSCGVGQLFLHLCFNSLGRNIRWKFFSLQPIAKERKRSSRFVLRNHVARASNCQKVEVLGKFCYISTHPLSAIQCPRPPSRNKSNWRRMETYDWVIGMLFCWKYSKYLSCATNELIPGSVSPLYTSTFSWLRSTQSL